MAPFVAIVALYLAQIACRSAQTIPVSIIVLFLIGLTWLGCVDSASQGEAFLTSSVLLLPFATVFFLPPSLSGRLRVTEVRSCWFRSPDLRLFLLGVLYWLALVLGHDGVGWPGALGTVLVHIFSDGPRPWVCLGLGNNCFLHYLEEVF